MHTSESIVTRLGKDDQPIRIRPYDAASLAGALDSCVHQLQQMRGMFDDQDGAIQKAIADAEQAMVDFHVTFSKSISVADLQHLVAMAEAYEEDIRTGLEDGTYEEGQNLDFPDRQAALSRVQAFLGQFITKGAAS